MRRYITALAGACLIASCQRPIKTEYVQLPPIHDTVTVIDTVYMSDSVCVNKYDSIRNKYYVQSYKLERIRYYVGICNNNRSQDKFLKGWLNRVLNH